MTPTGIDKVIVAVELHQLPTPDFRAGGDVVRAVLYAPRRFADMTTQKRVLATFPTGPGPLSFDRVVIGHTKSAIYREIDLWPPY